MKPSVKAIPRPSCQLSLHRVVSISHNLKVSSQGFIFTFTEGFSQCPKKSVDQRSKIGKLESASMLINLCVSQGLIKLRSMVKLPGYYSMLGRHLAQMQLLRCSCSDAAAQMQLHRCSYTDAATQMQLLRCSCSDAATQMQLLRCSAHRCSEHRCSCSSLATT